MREQAVVKLKLRDRSECILMKALILCNTQSITILRQDYLDIRLVDVSMWQLQNHASD